MSKGLVSLIDNRIAPTLALHLSRVLSASQTYRFADFFADRFAAHQEYPLIRALRLNQAVVRGLPADSPELDDVIRLVLRNAARGYADWFRSMKLSPQALAAVCAIDENLERAAQRALAGGRGLVLVGAHTSSFNILLLTLARRGLPIQVLTYPEGRGRYNIGKAVWPQFGLEFTPISIRSLRLAARRLERGGIVLTGADWPDPGGAELDFFGRKTRLLTGHARMALQTHSQVLVGVCAGLGPGRYTISGPPLIDPELSGDRHRDTLALAQRILGFLEDYIRGRPDEWLMFVPVWPEAASSQQT